MSESIFPWISTYLVNVAEVYGANMMSIPRFVKRKKVQLVEFLTYAENDVIWARISDKEHYIPIRFSQDAVLECNKLTRHRVTEHKSAIIFISDFKPFFARIPIGKNGMSSDAFLAIECNSFQLIGSYGESRFGNPKSLESNSDLHEWSDGLRKDGGAGNCLQLRKQAANKATKEAQHDIGPSRPPPGITTSTSTHISMQTARKTASNFKNAATNGRSTRHESIILVDHQEIWPVTRKPMFRRPPHDIASVLAKMKVEGDAASDNSESSERRLYSRTSESPHRNEQPQISALQLSSSPVPEKEPRSRSATPFSEHEWPPTNANQRPSSSPPALHSSSLSPIRPSAQAPPIPSSQAVSILTSQLPPPTPAQRTPRTKGLALPPSSPPSPSQAQESVLLPPPTLSPPTHARREVTRKVPRPLQPLPPSRTAAPIILAPNSDTSIPYSQSQSQSQSQQKLFSQPVIFSQLSALARPRKLPETHEEPAATDDIEMRDNTQYDPTNLPNALFSVASSQGEDYDGDQSSPTHSQSSQILPHLDAPPLPHSDSRHTDGTGGEDEGLYADDLADASLAVEAAASQASIDAVTTAEFSMDPAQELDQDDAQIHAELFGLTQEPSLPMSLPSEDGNFRLGNKETEASNSPELPHDIHGPQQMPAKLHLTPPSPDVVSAETEGKESRSSTTSDVRVVSSSVDEVQHDAVSWSAPSFLRASSGKSKLRVTKSATQTVSVASSESTSNSRSIQTPLALKKSRLVNGSSENIAAAKLPGKSHLNATSSSAFQNRPQGAPLIPGDQNNDPSQHGAREANMPQLSKQVYRSQEMSQTSDIRDLQSQGNKRGRDVASEDDCASDKPGGRHHTRKKRKLEVERHGRNKEIMPDEDDDEVVFVKTEYRSQVTVVQSGVKKKLNGYTVNLDKIVLADEKEPWMDWQTLYEIMLRTDEDREHQ